jgi:hypothetical protein
MAVRARRRDQAAVTRRRRVTWLATAALLAGCASGPPPPDWQMNAKSSLERAVAAYLDGNARAEVLEFARARSDVSRTGRIDLLARVELTRCAVRVASLEFDDCPAFAALAQDAAPAERAYAQYLAGDVGASAVLLPESHRQTLTATPSPERLRDIADPLSRLIAAGVLMRAGRAQPETSAIAAETASAQGWRRPLLAWLHVQAKGAEAAGAADEAARLRRRIDLVLNSGTSAFQNVK